MRAVIVKTANLHDVRSLYVRDGTGPGEGWVLVCSVSAPAWPNQAGQVRELTERAEHEYGIGISETQFERVTADDVQAGDLIARARSHAFEYVDAIGEGPIARHFLNANAQTIMRPRRTANLWRVA